MSSISRAWYRVSRDEVLWKSLFRRDWNINPKIGLSPGILVTIFLKFRLFIFLVLRICFFVTGKTSWFKEYIRLWQCTPQLETEVLKGHTHQVLHVSFSHNGKYFATCSKDGYILVNVKKKQLILYNSFIQCYNLSSVLGFWFVLVVGCCLPCKNQALL